MRALNRTPDILGAGQRVEFVDQAFGEPAVIEAAQQQLTDPPRHLARDRFVLGSGDS
ncbi:hypothetical protein IU487_29095 [Nocardia puris]|uniref:hypothetical protein n=1 Tax=Nocardia puris TaxID=208602 RepID=UPI001895E8E3|nr:hypothetical protein [Nocardia puris]MBF6215063.1 hypothetical protein [Nocardia puris]